MTGAPRHVAGFSLVELVIVVAMLGLVTGAIYSTYITNRKAAASQGEVVEVQHNLRVALDCLTRDLRMAGVLLPAGTTPLAAAAGSPAFPTYSTSIMINTASAEGRFVRVEIENPPDNNYTIVTTPTELDLPLEAPTAPDAPNSVDGFAVGDTVRLIRPLSGGQPLTGAPVLVVRGDPATNPFRGTFDSATPPAVVDPPRITMAKADGTVFTDGDTIRSSDMIAKVAGAAYPETVSYFLVEGGAVVRGFTCPAGERCLVRQVNGSPDRSDIIATNISGLEFAYLDDGYHEARVPAALAAVRAVRITLRGRTARTVQLSDGARLRVVSTVVKLRNRR